MGDRAPDLLPDLDATIVTYCSNPACPNSGQVADRLTTLGYTNVRDRSRLTSPGHAEGPHPWNLLKGVRALDGHRSQPRPADGVRRSLSKPGRPARAERCERCVKKARSGA
ncbi:hypothetical protein BCL76_12529 [Streptomyces sp. CG 926]|nr:hypothetical protein BCL76_12529 [Streptomyces sp. CG 926]